MNRLLLAPCGLNRLLLAACLTPACVVQELELTPACVDQGLELTPACVVQELELTPACVVQKLELTPVGLVDGLFARSPSCGRVISCGGVSGLALASAVRVISCPPLPPGFSSYIRASHVPRFFPASASGSAASEAGLCACTWCWLRTCWRGSGSPDPVSRANAETRLG